MQQRCAARHETKEPGNEPRKRYKRTGKNTVSTGGGWWWWWWWKSGSKEEEEQRGREREREGFGERIRWKLYLAESSESLEK